jgi:hypothetical protein
MKPAGDSDEVGQGGGSDREPVNGSVCDGLVRLGILCGAEFAQGFALQLKPVCAVEEAVEHCISNGGVADVSMPVVDWQLAGDHGRSAAVPIVDDFEQIAWLLGDERVSVPSHRE